MITGSSKVVMRSLLRGHGYLGKERVRFQFDISIEKVHGLHTGPHTIKWTRGGKVAYTKPFQSEKKTKESLVIGQKISLLCTLYCTRSNTSSSNSYDPKDSKLSLVSLKDGKKNEKTVGKIHFDIAQYAGVPNAEASITFKLNRKVSVDVTIGCTFVQLSKTSSGSVGSNMSGLSISSGEPEDDLREEDSEDELDIPFSPTTPVSKDVFDTTKEVFRSGHGNPISSIDNTAKTKISLSDFSSLNMERNCISGPNESVDRNAMPGKRDDAREDISFNGKARAGFLEVENISLRREINETRNELEKCRQLHGVSEEVITELRQALAQNELDTKAASNIQREALRTKTREMNEEIATIEKRAAQSARESTEQLRALRHQVDSIERAKQRVEDDLESAKREIQRLTTDQQSHTTPEIPPETQQKLRKVELDKKSAESRLLSEIAKTQELEEKFGDLNSEISQLHRKLHGHNKHSAEMKGTYDELSAMYENLREQNIQMQQELQECRSRSRPERFRGKEELNRTVNDQGNTGDSRGSTPEVEEIKTSLQDANRRIAHLEAEKTESQRKLTASSMNLPQLQQQLIARDAEHSKLLRDFEELKAAHLRSQEMLDKSSRKSSSLQARLAHSEQLLQGPGLVNSGGELAALSECPFLQQRIVKILTTASETKRTNKQMREELQQAYDRERLNKIEVLHLKAVIDRITQEIRVYSEHEAKKKEAMKLELNEARSRAERAESSVAVIVERESAHRREISKLEAIVKTLERKAEAAKESNNEVLAACKRDLKAKKEELETSAVRIKSFERELSMKKNIELSLSARVRELEIESEVIKKQAYHEVEISKAAAREAEMCNNSKSTQIEQYVEEIENLRVVSDSLRMKLQVEIDKAKEETKTAQQEVKDNRKLREEAEGSEKELEQKVLTQRSVIENLQRNLREAASTNRVLSEDAGKESKKLVQALEEKLALESRLKEAETILCDRERDIKELKDRIKSLEEDLERSNEESGRCIERATTKLDQKEGEITDLRQREEELREQLVKEQALSFEIHEELNLTLKSCAKLSAQHANAVDQVESLTSQLNEANHESARANTNFMDQLAEANHENVRAKANARALSEQNESLRNDLFIARNELYGLHEEVASLRTQLYELQNKLTACKAASEADTSQTAAELEEIKMREKSYRQEIIRKEELIEDLTAKLATAVGKSAADSAMAQAELSEALSREKLCKEEFQRHKEMLQKMEEELMIVRGANAFTTAELQSDLAEALSREETYRIELKRLKRLVRDLETDLDNEKKIAASLRTDRENSCERCSNGLTNVPREDDNTSAELRATKAVANALGFKESLSSSSIRKLDLFERITDARLLEMLVETKMQLALAEEEKLRLEHLIGRIGDRDRHMRDKLAQQASDLELKLTKTNPMVDPVQGNCSRGLHSAKNGRMSNGVSEREKVMTIRDHLPFFRRSSKGRKSTPTSFSERKQTKEEKKASRREPPVDEWDIGEDSDDGASRGKSNSGDTSLSTRSSGME